MFCSTELTSDSFFSHSTKARTSASIILRGANDFMCDEMERSIHDALCVVKRVLESKSVVPGGGAVEAALSIYLENYATSMVSLAQRRNNFTGTVWILKCFSSTRSQFHDLWKYNYLTEL